ncbi:LPXTG cell wall anchor domain-containing protein [uncultured Tateyamaria sp.]|uniref:LPXTG cell wall anchor domain-containing protein n=1 Tax=uncultured Tateyamaria sp. TaxID=455651 RepID=UPI00260EE493|nr:LPXTG cell wall anchor domain-containing protein [uncultured Tateyamaria sp.]
MKTPLITLATLPLMAAPALAHSGAHAHPHGSEPWIVVMGLALIVVAALVAWRRK